MNEYDGHWVNTYTGKHFHYLDPQPEEIDIIDIAHSLSLTCRYGGHCKQFYSVGDHSIRVAEIVPDGLKLRALLHDAAEAYLTDLPRPIKYDIPEFRIRENIIQRTIEAKFGIKTSRSPLIPDPDKKIIKWADNILLATEARDMMHDMVDWSALPDPLPEMILPMCSSAVENVFMMRFIEYSRKDN